jgi:hypothetical protein|tara:strand:- start:303 stop:1796 length:1494 start_codon:yes stop_codon:yes gene_type:complete
MLNFNLFIKKLQKILLSVNELIESFFNNIHKLIKSKKSKRIDIKKIDKNIIIGAATIIVLVIAYFLIPAFYNNNAIKSSLENQIKNQYNLEVKFNSELRYRIFPKPHFFSKNTSIIYEEKVIAGSDFFKANLSFSNLLSIKQIKIKDIFFKRTEFNINLDYINFFKEIFLSKKYDYGIFFKNSKIFYKNKAGDVLFLTKINNLELFNEEDSLNNEMKTNFELFKIPFSLHLYNDLETNKISSILKSKKIRLKIENIHDYGNEGNIGLFYLQVINDNFSLKYEIKNNSLDYISEVDNFKGKVDFKPFYFLSNINFKQLNLKKIFNDKSIFINLLNSEILNNQNLNANINLAFDSISNSNYLNDFIIRLYLQETKILFKNSTFKWNETVSIELEDVELINDNNQLKFIGIANFEFLDLTNFFNYYQIRRSHRSNIRNIKLDFMFDMNQEKITLDNFKIDNNDPENINKFINDFNAQKQNIFNKVTFKNFIKDFFSNYAG